MRDLNQDDDPVEGQKCPRCRHESVVYNGNYFCTRQQCGWVMAEKHSVHRIIKAYLIQRYRKATTQEEKSRMLFYLADYGWTEPEKMVIVEVKNCGNRLGLFRSVDEAKKAAQKQLDEYHEFYATLPAEELEESAPLTATTLTWSVQRLGVHGQVTEPPELGWDTTVAFYAEENGYFTLHEVEVGL